MIGRKKEMQCLQQLYASGRPELVAVYGRRRVGKTYLIDSVFQGRFAFRHAGLSPVEGKKKGMMRDQLEQFYYSLLQYGMKRSHIPKTWLEAFFMLENFLTDKDDGTRQVVFLDELPWMDTPRSGFITAFEGFWNNWGCHRSNLMVIVCGSASSWILDQLINNHGGLYGRVTREIKLLPFNLHECEEYFQSYGVRLSRYDIVQSYMIFGGIPYYLGYFEAGKSLPQNVDEILFGGREKLHEEYNRLFSSVFDNPEIMKLIVAACGSRNMGLTRAEIIKKTGIHSSGKLTQYLRALIAGDFITAYEPFGLKKRENYYKLTDPFCLFYLHFIKDNHKENDFWQRNQSSPAVAGWRGYAFENVCFNHVAQIKKALGISGVRTSCSAWTKRDGEDRGTQIDMLISRDDNIINMCEMKFYNDKFSVNKDYYQLLLHRQELLRDQVSPKLAIHNTLITTFGLVYNEYSGIFANSITMDDLFAE